jgi:hypothetical protein
VNIRRIRDNPWFISQFPLNMLLRLNWPQTFSVQINLVMLFSGEAASERG